MIKNLFAVLCLGSMSILNCAYAKYIVHSVTPGVEIEGAGKMSAAEQGKEVKANEFIIIPEGGEIEIYNDLDKNIYKSTKSGKISVTRLLIDAKKTASDNSKNVAARLRFAKNNAANEEGERIYVEKGMVRRSLEVFDPDAINIQVDSKTLASRIAGFINSQDTIAVSDVAVKVATASNDSTGVFFRIVNTLDFPIYFNVLKFDNTPEGDNRKVEISSLGQPDGSYVLLPGQAITRECFKKLPEDEQHLLVITHFRYDLDEVVDETGSALSNSENQSQNDVTFPLYIKNL